MTTPTETTGTCATCNGTIRHLSGPSWRHVGRRKGKAHPADPDQATRERMREMDALGKAS
ncbi:hypothetical protein AB0F72_08510 [Actinoplanes sp. NPDC023936]|uniref:hypothetical protein n=1 Tax=Actinoplanes sp. NPDC023936 TaxID=3154910 RepID=UPI0033E9A553